MDAFIRANIDARISALQQLIDTHKSNIDPEFEKQVNSFIDKIIALGESSLSVSDFEQKFSEKLSSQYCSLFTNPVVTSDYTPTMTQEQAQEITAYKTSELKSQIRKETIKAAANSAIDTATMKARQVAFDSTVDERKEMLQELRDNTVYGDIKDMDGKANIFKRLFKKK